MTRNPTAPRGWVAAALISIASLSGCNFGAYFVRAADVPMRALEGRMDTDERRQCLIVFMPGMLDSPDDFVSHGFFREAHRSSTRCDLVAADAHFGYYRDGIVRQRVSQDILTVAEARGYEEIWLVGISMGGLGTLLATQVRPHRVRGIVLLAPFLGDPALVRSIGEAGGLEAWDAPEDVDMYDADEFDDSMWGWLQGYATQPESMPQLYVGVGTEDSLRPGVALLAEVLPPEHSGTVVGGHGWDTWSVLWRRLMQSPPWDPGLSTPSLSESSLSASSLPASDASTDMSAGGD